MKRKAVLVVMQGKNWAHARRWHWLFASPYSFASDPGETWPACHWPGFESASSSHEQEREQAEVLVATRDHVME